MKYQGLNEREVEESRKKYGSNLLTPPVKEPLWRQFLRKFSDPIIKILLLALLLSLGVSFYQYFCAGDSWTVVFEPLGIFVAVMLATCVSFAFEVSANKKFEILNQVNDEEQVKVVRNGNITMLSRKDIVVGDVVVIETGDEIPADGDLLESFALQVNESDLTGEPMAKKTTDERDFSKDSAYPSNRILRGSKVIDGHGVMLVDKVGDNTEWGKVYRGSQIDNDIVTPLDQQLGRLAKIITKLSYIIASLIVIIRLAFYFSSPMTDFQWLDFVRYLLNTFMLAVTIVVVAVPEGLPMSVTLSLALSMKRMLKTNNLVRKMHACETMGATTVICTDKTGTLTMNQMSVNDLTIYGLPENKLGDDDVSKILSEGMALNTTAFLDFSNPKKIQTIGNPTEGAILLWLNKQGFDFMACRESVKELYQQVPFSTKYKFMATVVKSPTFNKPMFYVKGAPEIVLKHCDKVLTENGVVGIEPYIKKVEEQLLKYQGQAMRTLALAYKVGNPDEQSFDPKTDDLVAENLILLGVVAIADPVRSDVAEAVADCLGAGISIKVVTGDTSGTAIEIGRQLGLWNETDDKDVQHIAGKDFEALDDDEALRRAKLLKIMSRARPMDKERLVRLLQDSGEVVAVTGDGTNDAPALKKAQVGLSMGDGTTVAKEASDITILDNSFKSIGRAVMWGRSLYLNIQRFILFQMTINVAACVVVMLGAFLDTEPILTVTQMLWVNIIMDSLASLALSSLPPEGYVMKEKPRDQKASIITKKMMWGIFGIGLAFVILMLGLVQYFKHAEINSLADDFSLAAYFGNFFNFDMTNTSLSRREMAYIFSIFVFFQFWNIFNAKSFGTGRSGLSRLFDKDVLSGFVLSVFVILVGQFVIVNFAGPMFNVEALPWSDWLWMICATSPVFIIGDIVRLFIKDR